jgi:hypothetical protein
MGIACPEVVHYWSGRVQHSVARLVPTDTPPIQDHQHNRRRRCTHKILGRSARSSPAEESAGQIVRRTAKQGKESSACDNRALGLNVRHARSSRRERKP